MPGPAYASGKRGKTIHLRSVIHTFTGSSNPDRSNDKSFEDERSPIEISDSFLAQIYKKLGDKTCGYHERAQTAVEVRQRLDDFQANFIPSLWYSANDLVALEVPQSTRRVALELLLDCVNRCEDESQRYIYFCTTLDILKLSLEEGGSSIDPNVDLLLACLKECLSSTKLSEEESTLSACVIEEVISKALQNPKNMPWVALPILIDIVMDAKTPVRESPLLELMDLLFSFLTIPDANNARLYLCIVDYVLHLMRRHDTLLSPEVVDQLAVFSEKMAQSNDARHVAKLSCMLRVLAESALKKEFLDQLLHLTLEKMGHWDFVLERYATYFVESFNGGNKDEIEILLNKLYCMKKDKITLKIIEKLLENASENQTLEREDISADSLIWALIRSIFTRFRDGSTKTQFTNALLNLLAINDLIAPPSIDNLIQLICELQLPIDCSGLVRLAGSRRQELRDIATLNMIIDRVLVLDAPQHGELFELLSSLMQDTELGLFSNEKDIFALITNIFVRSRTIELSEIACPFFAELTYLCLQRLSDKYFSSLIHDQILLDIKAILTKKKRRKSIVNTIGTFGRSKQPIDQQLSKIDALVECLVKGFIWSATEVTGYKTTILFDTLYSVYNVAEKCDHENTLLTVARAMVRIRCDSKGFFYFTNLKDAVGISSALGRFKDNLQGKDLKWIFPEKLSYIDESLLYVRNKNVLFAAEDKPREGCIDMAKWLCLAVNTIKAPMAWDIYSYLLTHLCSQLSAVALFQDHPGLINDLKTVICQHLTSKLPSTVELEGSASRCNLQAAFVRNLSSVLTYHPYEPKEFADEMVSAIVIGVASWEKALIPVLHILCVSCYEVPLSVKKNLSPMLLQIQKRMTNCYAIPSILEFFIALKNSPAVIMNLTVEETKRVFAIVFKLIEYSVDLTLRSRVSDNESSRPKTSQPHNQEYEVDISSSTETFFVGEAMAEFFEYQSFMVLTFWYLCLNSTRKKELFPFVMGGLRKLQDVEGLKYDVLAHVDFITRSQFVSQEDWNIDENEVEVIEDHTNSARWIYNTTLMSIKSRGKRAVIVVWKPTCTFSFAFEPLAKVEQKEYKLFGFEKPEDSVTTTEDVQSSDCAIPRALLSQLCYLLGIPDDEQDKMLRVPDDPILDRSISTLDRIPNKELQKTGIIYIGPNQNTEEQILSNTEGTYQYKWFLSQMGYFIKLSERSKLFYIGGLEDVIDGEYALIWSDEATQIAFHTVTLFPESSDLSTKKRHVGNNFVNIFYDESGLPDFNFNIIKSQFTFISIVITPHTTHDSPTTSEHYTVKLYRRTGTPGLFSCAHFKILTKLHLARYVRHISQIANAFAQKIHEQHSFYACSAWGIRCKQLNTIRERVARSQSISSKH